jgi:hypothetical protein
MRYHPPEPSELGAASGDEPSWDELPPSCHKSKMPELVVPLPPLPAVVLDPVPGVVD